MPRDARNQPPAPLTRPAPRSAGNPPAQPVPAPLQAAVDRNRKPDQEQPAAETRSTPYGGSVRMAFVFLAPEVQERIERAAGLDEEKVGTWMARVLDDAARARIEFWSEASANDPPADESEDEPV